MTFLKNFFIFRPSCCLWDRCTQAKDIYLDVWCLITCRPLWRVSPPTSSPGSFGLGLLILLRPTWTGSSPRSASSIGTNRPEQGESTGVTGWKLMSSDVPGCQGQSSLGPDRYFRPWSRRGILLRKEICPGWWGFCDSRDAGCSHLLSFVPSTDKSQCVL